MVICMMKNVKDKEIYGTKYSPLYIKIAILKHDIRRAIRSYSKMNTNSSTAIDALAYLDRLVNGINIPNNNR